jgi:hypothetical protein
MTILLNGCQYLLGIRAIVIIYGRPKNARVPGCAEAFANSFKVSATQFLGIGELGREGP